MSKIGETLLVVAALVVATTLVASKVDCGKIPLVGTYCVAH